MERIEEFTIDGKNFMYIDLSHLMANDEFVKITEVIEPLISKYPLSSLYTITNIENIRFDSKSKDMIAKYMSNNKPYVKYGAVIGLDGIKKKMVNLVSFMSGRKNLCFAFTKEQAIEMLLKKE